MSDPPTVLYQHKRADAQLLEWDMTMHASAIRAAVCSIEGKLERRPTLPSMYGKEAHMQRNHAFFCAPGASHGYFFSKQLAAAQAITEPLQHILDIVNSALGADFNGILVNEYEGGDDYISDHRDDEVGLSARAGVLTLSWGAERTLRIKEWDAAKNRPRTKGEGGWVHEARTRSCHALHMRGAHFQKVLSHGIPKEKCHGRRVSFTFRVHDKSTEQPMYERWLRARKKRSRSDAEPEPEPERVSRQP